MQLGVTYCCNTLLRHTAATAWYNALLQHTAATHATHCCNTLLQHFVSSCNSVWHTAATHCCNTCNTLLQHTTATHHCNTVYHQATLYDILLQELLRHTAATHCYNTTAAISVIKWPPPGVIYCYNTLLQHRQHYCNTTATLLQHVLSSSDLVWHTAATHCCNTTHATHCCNTSNALLKLFSSSRPGVKWPIHMCDMTHSCMWHDSFM